MFLFLGIKSLYHKHLVPLLCILSIVLSIGSLLIYLIVYNQDELTAIYAPFGANLYQLLLLLILSMVIMVLGIIFFGIKAAKSTTHPLNSLKNGVTKVANGDLEVELIPKSQDEIGALTAAFNEMTYALKVYKSKSIEQAQAIQAQADILSSSNNELTEYAHTVSHDLKAPLRMVSSYARLLQKRFDHQLEEEGKEYLQYVIEGTQRMRRIVDDLLEYAQFDKKYAQKKFVNVDINEVLGSVLHDLKLQIDENNAQVIIDKLPMIKGNMTQMHLLFQNLIANALKYRRIVSPIIRINVTEQQDHYLIKVKDNGQGIEQCYWDEIFKPFKRLVSQYEVEGNGIGLSTVKKIVAYHKGKIWVESKLEVGSTFYISLPKTKVVPLPIQQINEPNDTLQEAVSLKTLEHTSQLAAS